MDLIWQKYVSILYKSENTEWSNHSADKDKNNGAFVHMYLSWLPSLQTLYVCSLQCLGKSLWFEVNM